MAVTTAPTFGERVRVDVGTFVRPGVVFSVLVSAAALARVLASRAHEGMWADDGVYLEVVHDEPIWRSVFYAHHGYLNLGQMVISSSLEWVPIRYAPIAFVVAWAVGVGVLASYVAAVSEPLLSSMWSRAFLGASVALIPVAGYESAGTVANLQWSALAAVTIALVAEPEPRRWRSALPWLIALTAASAPAALALAPLVVWRRERRWVVVGWGVGVGAQLVAVAASWGERDAAGDWSAFESILQTFTAMSVNAVTSLLPQALQLSPLGVLIVAVIAAAAVRDRHRLAMPAILVGAALLQWWFTYTGGGLVPVVPRYAIVPAICALALLLGSAETLGSRLHFGVLVVLAACWVAAGPVSEYRAAGPNWQDQIDAVECSGGVQQLELLPSGWGSVELPC